MENVIGQVRIDEGGKAWPLVHFAYPSGVNVMRKGRSVPRAVIGCQPQLEPGGDWRCTDDVQAVTCPACKLCDEYKKVVALVRPMRPRWKD